MESFPLNNWFDRLPRAWRGCERRSGFTLMEVVVSSVLLAILFSAVIRSFSYSRRAVSLIENRLHFTQIARREMEILKAKPFNDQSLGINTYREIDLSALKARLEDEKLELYFKRCYYSVGFVAGSNNQIKDITVVVDWVEPTGMEQSVSLTSSIGMALHK